MARISSYLKKYAVYHMYLVELDSEVQMMVPAWV